MTVTSYDVSVALDALGIDHDAVFWMEDNHNIAFTDHSKVFCKVVRHGFDNGRLCRLELDLANEYGSEIMCKPLVDHVVTVGDTVMSVWQWEKMETFVPNSISAEDARSAAYSLLDIHGLDHPNTKVGVMESFDRFAYNVKTRTEYGLAHGASQHHVDILLRLAEKYVDGAQFEPGEYVFVHGDPHVGNAAKRNDSSKVTWIDFESAKLASKEMDLATLKISLSVIGGNDAAWTAVEDVFLAESHIDETLMAQYTAARLVSMTSYALLREEDREVFNMRAELLEPLLDGGEMPARLPATVTHRMQ